MDMGNGYRHHMRRACQAQYVPFDVGDMGKKIQALCRNTAIFLIAASPLLFALLTWEPDYSYSPVRSFSLPVVLIEFLVTGLAVISGRFLPAIRSASKTVLALITVIVLIQLYTLTSVAVNEGAAIIQFVTTLGHILFAFSCKGLLEEKDSYLRMLAAVAVGLFLFVVMIYGLALSVADKPDFLWHRFGAAATNVRHLGYYAALLVALTLGLYMVLRKRWILAGVVLGLAFLFWTSSRGGLFAIGTMIIAVWIMAGWHKARMLGIICLLAALPALGLASIWVPDAPSWGPFSAWDRSTGISTQDPSNGRIKIWTSTVQQGVKHPFFGWGEGQFKYTVPAARTYYNHPHNAPLQFFYQWGVSGLAAMLMLLFFALKKTRISIRQTDGIALAGFMGFAAMLGFSLVDGTLYYPYPVMMTLTCLGVMMADKNGPMPSSDA